MSDSEFSDASIDSTVSTVLLQERYSPSDIEEDESLEEGNYFTEQGQKILKINSKEYNKILNHQIPFRFNVLIGTPNSDEPTLDLLERLTKTSEWNCDSFKEHTRTGELKNMTVHSGTIHRALLLHSYNLPPYLYEIIAQVVGIAQKDPSLPVCQGNEVILLVRDPIKRDPVIQVIQPYYLQTKIPDIFVGQMIKCIGKLMDSHQMQAVRIMTVGFVPNQT